MADQNTFSLDVIAPVFPVTDLARARDYYTEKLLFTVKFEWADRDGEPVRYAILENGKVELHLTAGSAARPVSAYIFVDRVSAYCDAVRARGARITADIEDHPWEMREFEISDPDGNRLIFGEHLSRIGDRGEA